MMFQTRSFTFTLSNPSLTALSYQWQILDKAGNPDTSGGCLSCTNGPATALAVECLVFWGFGSAPAVLTVSCQAALGR